MTPTPPTHTQPLYAETARLLDCVAALDLDSLRGCIREFASVDVDPQGKTIILTTEGEWDDYMRANFALMRDLHASVTHAITDYRGEATDTLGYSVVRFRQTITIGGEHVVHHCIATVLWRRAADGWRQIHWHCSIAQPDDPGGAQAREAAAR